MHKKYSVDLSVLQSEISTSGISVSNENLDYGYLCTASRDKVIKDIKRYVEENEEIDATVIMDKLFPDYVPHLFISHKSQDSGTAIALANILYKKYKVVSFIDSQVWHHIDDVQKIINNHLNKLSEDGDSITYSHRGASIVSSNIFAMLASSLYQTMDMSDGFIFIDRDSGICKENERMSKGNMGELKTISPWVYLETKFSNMLRESSHNRNIPVDIIKDASISESQVGTESFKEPKFIYTNELVKTTHLSSINCIFEDDYDGNNHKPLTNLDHLYSLLDRSVLVR